MNWINRYVAQVKWYLPADDRDDIGDEIQSLLREQADDREQALGRPLTEAEAFALLKEFGHPLQVAAAYKDTGPLISAALFPLYALVIRYLVIFLLAAWVLSQIFFQIAGHRLPFGDIDTGDLLDLGIFYFGAITLGFHLTDRFLVNQNFFSNWNPAKLPVLDAERESLFGLALTLLALVIWFGLLSRVPVDHTTTVLLGETANRVHTFVLWLKLQVLLCLPAYLWLLLRPHWTAAKRLIIILSDVLIIIGIGITLDIDPASPTAFQIGPDSQWETSMGVVRISSLILSLWMLGIFIDLVSQAFKLSRSMRTIH